MAKILGIGGNSGSGKSTLANKIKDEYPEKVSILYLDDYQKVGSPEEVPDYKGMTNWDCPEAVKMEKLVRDLRKLRNGKEITIMSWVSEVNPTYEDSNERIPHQVEPKKLVILEGYLTLWKKEVRSLCDLKLYLDIPIEDALERREKPVNSREYREQVLVPMAKKYVETTKENADYVLNAKNRSEDELFEKTVELIIENDFL